MLYFFCISGHSWLNTWGSPCQKCLGVDHVVQRMESGLQSTHSWPPSSLHLFLHFFKLIGGRKYSQVEIPGSTWPAGQPFSVSVQCCILKGPYGVELQNTLMGPQGPSGLHLVMFGTMWYVSGNWISPNHNTHLTLMYCLPGSPFAHHKIEHFQMFIGLLTLFQCTL